VRALAVERDRLVIERPVRASRVVPEVEAGAEHQRERVQVVSGNVEAGVVIVA